MRVINNGLIPSKGKKAINILGFVFCRRGEILNCVERNHLKIHTAQMKELLYVFYYLIYAVDYVCMWFGSGCSSYLARKCVCFEVEASYHELNLDYLRKRRKFEWIHHIL